MSLLQDDGSAINTLSTTINYVPLLHVPPLHLAIMVAKDSPLTIDCPASKFPRLSSTHGSIDAVIAKFRMTAYMWQALVAEEMRSKGLGRRTFRLEEEWTTDTVSNCFTHRHDLGVGSTAKVHIVASEKRVAELRQLSNRSNRKGHDINVIFAAALQQNGLPFSRAENQDVVAGLILDTHYDPTLRQLQANARNGSAVGSNGLSVAAFGSQLTWAWPRFVEEVANCLQDSGRTYDLVGMGGKKYQCAWEACAGGQIEFLTQVRRALGASSNLETNLLHQWRDMFISPQEREQAPADTRTFDLADMLSLRLNHLFRTPGHDTLRVSYPGVIPKVSCVQGDTSSALIITCACDIVQVRFNDKDEATPSIQSPSTELNYSLEELEKRVGRDGNLSLTVLALNGKQLKVRNALDLFGRRSTIRVPNTSIVLNKFSVMDNFLDEVHRTGAVPKQPYKWDWATLFKKKSSNGEGTFTLHLRTSGKTDNGQIRTSDIRQ